MIWIKSFIKAILTLVVSAGLGFSAYAQTNQVETDGSEKKSKSQNQGTSQGAGIAKAAQMVGAGANLAMGAAMLKPCMAPPPGKCMYCCAAAAMSFANGATMLADSQQSSSVEDLAMEVPDWDSLFDDPEYDLDGIGNGGPRSEDELSKRISEGLGLARDQGFVYDSESNLLSTPDGKQLSPEIMNNPEAAAAAGGFSPSNISSALGSMEAIAEKFNRKIADLDKTNRPSVSGMGFDSGGGASSAYSGGSGFKSGIADYLSKMRRGIASKKKAVVAGKSKNYGGEQIGVKVDNLFDMVHRRYQVKRTANIFLEKVVTKNK